MQRRSSDKKRRRLPRMKSPLNILSVRILVFTNTW